MGADRALEAVLEVEQTFDILLPPSSSTGRKRKKKAKREMKNGEALEEHNAPCESERILEQVEHPRVFDEVSEAVLPAPQEALR